MKKKLSGLLLVTSLLGGGLFFSNQSASAHGYVETPPARGYQGKLDIANLGWSGAHNHYGNVITNPQSLEAPKGYPNQGPADGRIASANGGLGQINDFVLDNQQQDRWKKTDIHTGENTLTWLYTAKHRTTKWHYYMTKPGWDQNSPLTRDTMVHLQTINHDGSMPSDNDGHKINIPNDRIGYHVILAIWDIDDTSNAFYNVIDVNVKHTGLPVMPTVPSNLTTTNITKESIALTWDGQAAANKYHIYRDGVKIATSTTNRFEDKHLTPDTKYQYEIVAESPSGQLSAKSTMLPVHTLSAETIEKPTAPRHLHSMGETHYSVSLMWGKSTHTAGIQQYDVYRDGQFIGQTAKTTYDDTGLKPATTYTYKVKAVSNSGQHSDFSGNLALKTKNDETPSPELPEEPAAPSDVRTFKIGSHTKPELYRHNEQVYHQGKTYTTLVTHQNYGDTNWSPNNALSLFKST